MTAQIRVIDGAAGPLSIAVRPGRPGGPVVLLIHPANLAGACWTAVVGALGPEPTCVMPDLRGYGASTRNGPFGVAEWADDCARALDAVALGPVHVVGASVGAAVAVLLAATRPAVRTLGTVGGAFLPAPVAGDPLLTRLRLGPLDDDLRQTMADASVAPGTDRRTLDRIVATIGEHETPVLVESWRAALAVDVRPWAPRLELPCWVAVGELDTVCTPAESRWFAETVGGLLHLLAGVGHLPMYEAPAAVAALIADHLVLADVPAVTSRGG